MKTRFQSLLITALTLSSFAVQADDAPLSIAVFDFNSPYRVKGRAVADLITATLSTDPKFVTLDRSSLSKSLGEQALGLSGNISPGTAAKVGQQIGAKVLITGRLVRSGKDFVLTATVTGAESGRVYVDKVQGPDSDLDRLTADLSKKIITILSAQSTNLVVKVETREDRLERILQDLKGGKRPSVLVRIAEQFPDKSTVNSTAERELGFILQKAGFTLMDEKSKSLPDVEITGEAICELGARKGEMYTSAAVVEIKVRDRTSGKILVIDRQKNSAVDIGKQTAAIAALESAADELAVRLLPLLSH